jgi:hypothetical protein
MSAEVSAFAGLSEFGALTDNTATTIYTASQGGTRIRSITACETAGATPTLTVDIYDVANTTAYHKRKAVAMTAGTEIVFNEPFYLPPLWAIRLTSSSLTGGVDWTLTYDAPSRAAAGRG